MTKAIDKEFALQILQAHIRNALELDSEGRFKDDHGSDELEAVIARTWAHTSKLIESIYEEPGAYGFIQMLTLEYARPICSNLSTELETEETK